MASTLALQCSTNWALKTHMLGTDQFIEFIFTRDKNETWNEVDLNCENTDEIEMRSSQFEIAIYTRRFMQWYCLQPISSFEQVEQCARSSTLRLACLILQFPSIICQVVAYERLKTIRNFKLLALGGRTHLPVADPDLELTGRAGRGVGGVVLLTLSAFLRSLMLISSFCTQKKGVPPPPGPLTWIRHRFLEMVAYKMFQI